MELLIPLMVAGCLAVWYYWPRTAPHRVAAEPAVPPAPPPNPFSQILSAPAGPEPPPEMALPSGDWQSLVGQRIEAVVINTRGGVGPQNQVYLVFEGDVHFEIFSWGHILGNSHLHRGGLPYMLTTKAAARVSRVYTAVPAPGGGPSAV